MIADSLRSYKSFTNEKSNYGKEPVAKFEEGQAVFMVNEKGVPYDDEILIVEKAHFNSLIRIFQYTFKGKGFACGEQNLIADLSDKPSPLSDCIFEPNDGILKEIINSHSKIMGGRGIAGQLALMFFQPDNVFIEWLVEYAAGRLIIDVGCGSGRVTNSLNRAGAKVIGIDPYFDMDKMMEFNMDRIERGEGMLHILPKHIEDCATLFQSRGDQVLLLFARPCHGQFVENALKMKDKETEALYITMPKNLELYNDLGVFDGQQKLIEHEGYSVEEEKVYSIR